MPLGCNDIDIINLDFVAKIQILWKEVFTLIPLTVLYMTSFKRVLLILQGSELLCGHC